MKGKLSPLRPTYCRPVVVVASGSDESIRPEDAHLKRMFRHRWLLLRELLVMAAERS